MQTSAEEQRIFLARKLVRHAMICGSSASTLFNAAGRWRNCF